MSDLNTNAQASSQSNASLTTPVSNSQQTSPLYVQAKPQSASNNNAENINPGAGTSNPSVNNVAEMPLQNAPEITTTSQITTAPLIDDSVNAPNDKVNIDSIISEISSDLKNNKPQVETTAQDKATTTLDYNLSAPDTFQENYNNKIEINNPVNVNSSENGIKEIKPVEDNIQSQIVNNLGNDKLQYKNYTLEEILEEAVKRKASDIHLTPGYRATFRIDGNLKTFNSPILNTQNVKGYAAELIKNRKDINLEELTEFDLTYTLGNLRFRVNIFRQMATYSIVLRVINETIFTIEDLGLPPILNSLTKFANGLILLTGPTGSGKSTTLASLLNTINMSTSKHIVTLEDPVEYVLPKGLSVIDQREFGTDFSSWANALRAVLRQDPDIVLIGEMRDLESVESALRVAETGHLVFATLHTNSAAQSIDRIIDIFPSDKQAQIRTQLASVIRAVVSQRLVPMTQGSRKPAVEVVFSNSAVQNAIRENKIFLIDNIIQTSAEEGMISLEKSLVQLVRSGQISAETAKSFSVKPAEIDMLLSK